MHCLGIYCTGFTDTCAVGELHRGMGRARWLMTVKAAGVRHLESVPSSRGVTLGNGAGQMDIAIDNLRNRIPRDTGKIRVEEESKMVHI